MTGPAARTVLAVLAVLALASVVACSSGGGGPTASGPSTRPATSGPADREPEDPGPSTKAAVDGPVVTSAGAFLQPVAGPAPGAARYTGQEDCAALGAPGLDVSCTESSTLLAVAEEGPNLTAPVQVTIYALGAGIATPRLRFTDADKATVAGVTVRTPPLGGRSGDGLAVGFRSQGSGSNLELDLLDGEGRVSAHRSYEKGRAVLSSASVDGWTARFGPDDPNCCPSTYHHEHLVFDGAVWHLDSEDDVPAAAVPVGDFP